MQLLVTGAANGIGASLTELAMKKGHRVIATDADIKALNQRWEHQPSVRCEPLDVRDEAQWKRLISKLEDEEQTIEMLEIEDEQPFIEPNSMLEGCASESHVDCTKFHQL